MVPKPSPPGHRLALGRSRARGQVADDTPRRPWYRTRTVNMIIGVLLGLGASASWATANVAIQRSGRTLGPVRALLWAQILGAMAAGAVSPLLDRPTASVDLHIAVWTLVAAVASLLAYASLFYAFAHTTLSTSVPIMSSWAVISAALSIGILGERLGPRAGLGAGLVLAGVILVAVQEGLAARAIAAPASSAPSDPARGRTRRRALLASFGAAVGFGVMVPAVYQVAPAYGAFGTIAIVYLVEIALGLPLALALRQPLGFPPRRTWSTVAAAGVCETVGFVCITVASGHAPAAVVAPTASLGASLTVAYAWLVLGERPGRLAALGALLACGGVILLAR